MKVQAYSMGAQAHLSFRSTRELDKEFHVTIPANIAYYATCSLYDEQAKTNIDYEVEIDIEDDAIVDPNQRVNYFLFSNGNTGPQRR